jgi:hypothetical protein
VLGQVHVQSGFSVPPGFPAKHVAVQIVVVVVDVVVVVVVGVGQNA